MLLFYEERSNSQMSQNTGAMICHESLHTMDCTAMRMTCTKTHPCNMSTPRLCAPRMVFDTSVTVRRNAAQMFAIGIKG